MGMRVQLSKISLLHFSSAIKALKNFNVLMGDIRHPAQDVFAIKRVETRSRSGEGRIAILEW